LLAGAESGRTLSLGENEGRAPHQESADVATSTPDVDCGSDAPAYCALGLSLEPHLSLSLSLWLSPNVRPPRVHSGCCSTFVVVSIFLFALVGFVFVGVFLSLSGFFWYSLEQQPENLIDS